MNNAQRQHVLSRLNNIMHERTNALEQKLEAKVDATRTYLTPAVLIDGIKDGTIKLLPGQRGSKEELNRWTDVYDIFNVAKYDTDELYGPYPELEKLEARLNKERQRIEDELYLGDEANALSMIKAFETFK